MPKTLVAMTLISALLALSSHARERNASQARIVPLQSLTKDFEVIFGDPEVPGQPFVIRIRELPGTVIPPHTHPIDEHITVLQGTFFFAVSDKYDPSLLKELRTGGYAFAPKGSTMFGASPEGAIVQVHGIGPFHIHWRDGFDSMDHADADKVFRFRKGDVVTTPRGIGTIRKGYASGPIIQYEIEVSDKTLFMVDDAKIRSHKDVRY